MRYLIRYESMDGLTCTESECSSSPPVFDYKYRAGRVPPPPAYAPSGDDPFRLPPMAVIQRKYRYERSDISLRDGLTICIFKEVYDA